MSEAPEIRVSYLKSDLEALAHLERDVEGRVRARIPDVIAAAREAIGIGWLPVELDVRVTEAVAAEAGMSGVRACAKQGVLRSIETPLLGPIRAALTRMGLDPHSALRRIPQAWPLVFRACCVGDYVRLDDARAQIRLKNAVPVFFDEAYLTGIGAAFEGLIEAAGGRDAEVTLTLDAPTRTARYACRWSPRAQGTRG